VEANQEGWNWGKLPLVWFQEKSRRICTKADQL